MPLFLTPSQIAGRKVEIPELRLIRGKLEAQIATATSCRREARELGVRPMAIVDQQRLQLRLLEEALQIIGARP
jgi:hypothetical protein